MTLNDNILVQGFVKSIKEGKMSIEQVPDKYKEEVQEALEKWND